MCYNERSSSSQEQEEVINKGSVRMAEWFVAASTHNLLLPELRCGFGKVCPLSSPA